MFRCSQEIIERTLTHAAHASVVFYFEMSQSVIGCYVQTPDWAKFYNKTTPLRHDEMNFAKDDDWIVNRTSICAESASRRTT